MKTCPKCSTSKPITEFSKSKGRADGLNGHCKICVREYVLKLREKRKLERVDPPVINKICPGCNENKLITEFGRNVTQADGLAYKCKACRNSEKKAYTSGFKAEGRFDIHGSKCCTVCGDVKAMVEFCKDNSKKSGRSSRCKDCSNTKAAEYKLKRRESYQGPSVLGKKCCCCGEEKLASKFPKSISSSDGLRNYCTTCKRERSKDARLQRQYGITIQEYKDILSSQNMRCACCGTKKCSAGLPFCVDHDHNTGEVRGLLCQACNTSIGKLGDTIEGVRKALDYLTNPPVHPGTSNPSLKK